MICEEDVLYIDILDNNESNIDINKVLKIKDRIFNFADIYEINNIVIKIRKSSNFDKNFLKPIICGYHKRYKGNILIDIK